MIQKYFFIFNYFLIIAFAFVYFKKIENSFRLKLFLIFLVYSFFTEIIGTYTAYYLRKPTIFIYNLFYTINYLFYLFFFLSIVKEKNKRIIIKSLISIILVFFAFLFEQSTTRLLINFFIVGNLSVVISIMIYYSELLQNDIVLKLQNSMYFWLSLGVLFYNIGFLPVYVIAEYIAYMGVFRYITFGLNIVLSISFIIGFIVSKKEYNS